MATATPTIVDEARWQGVQERGLDHGDHASVERGMCAMEAASYIAREPWSDHPACVDIAIGAFMRSWNDVLPKPDRDRLLLPLIPLTVGTAGSSTLAERRAIMAVDWFIREHTPAWLRLAGLTTQAENVAALPEITATAQMPSLRGPLEAARKDAAAARVAARDAAWVAAWEAARDAARGAARDAAGVAAWDATWDALQSTTAQLQASAARLVERICALREAA